MLKTPWYLLKGTDIVTHWPAFLVKENYKGKTTCECLYVLRELGLFISENMDNKNGWKEENMDLTWKSLQKEIGFENPTQLMNQVFLGCTQREATVDPQAVQSKTEWFKKLTTIREVDGEDQTKETDSLQKITAWSNDMAGHAEKRVAIYCEFAKQHVFSSNRWQLRA